jgi:hypothetical protein
MVRKIVSLFKRGGVHQKFLGGEFLGPFGLLDSRHVTLTYCPLFTHESN